MSSSFINVDTDRLKRDVESMLEELEVAKMQIKNLYDSVQVLNGMWDGPANDEFTKQFTADYMNVTGNLEDIKKYIDGLDNCRSSYDECDNTVGQIIGTMGF